ncbi:hypothetical protein ALO75_04967, partial [Pseudomonas syringae pv. coryli]
MTQSVTNGIPTRSMDTIVRALSFLTLQHGNALRDALRHKSTPRYRLKAGRGASG